jgi:hypothetical protein
MSAPTEETLPNFLTIVHSKLKEDHAKLREATDYLASQKDKKDEAHHARIQLAKQAIANVQAEISLIGKDLLSAHNIWAAMAMEYGPNLVTGVSLFLSILS